MRTRILAVGFNRAQKGVRPYLGHPQVQLVNASQALSLLGGGQLADDFVVVIASTSTVSPKAMKKLCGLAKPPKVIIQKALTTAKALLWLEAYAEASKEELLLGSGKPVHEVPRPATNGSVSGSLVSSRNGGAAAKFVSVDLLSPTCLFLRDALEQRGIGYNPVLRRTRPRLVSLQRTEVFSGNAGPEAPTEDRKTAAPLHPPVSHSPDGNGQ